MQYDLGADETKPSDIPFVRFLSPTEVQKVTQYIRDDIAKQTPGIDWANPMLYSRLGLNNASGPVADFMQYLLQYERETKTSVSAEGVEYFIDWLNRKGKLNADDIAAFTKSYLSALAMGVVPESIQKPWDYTPTTVTQDILAASGVATKSIAPLLLGAIAVYAAVTVLLPKLILRKS